jgi:hypothetical protein
MADDSPSVLIIDDDSEFRDSVGVDMDPDRDALGKPHPGEDGVDICNALTRCLCVRDVDPTRRPSAYRRFCFQQKQMTQQSE